MVTLRTTQKAISTLMVHNFNAVIVMELLEKLDCIAIICKSTVDGAVVRDLDTDNSNQNHGVYQYRLSPQPGSPTPYFTPASSASDTVLPPTRPPEHITKPVLMGRAVSQGPPLSHSERGKAHTPSSPPLRVIAMADRRIPQDCCPLPAVIRMCQTVSPDLPCYSDVQYNVTLS
ncbi:UNVERIFIED_CONTAM: hypothetical protein FKN15_005627 [Acipenser sinensis]